MIFCCGEEADYFGSVVALDDAEVPGSLPFCSIGVMVPVERLLLEDEAAGDMVAAIDDDGMPLLDMEPEIDELVAAQAASRGPADDPVIDELIAEELDTLEQLALLTAGGTLGLW